MKITLAFLRKLHKKCQENAIPKTDDGKYWILDKKTRTDYNKKIKQEV